MPYCPTCKQSFSQDTAECPIHRVPLVDELPFQTVEGDTTTWVEIASAGTEDEAKLIQGFLEAEGIPCQVESLKFNMEPVNLGVMSEIRVYVTAEHEEQAQKLLREREKEYEKLRGEDDIITDEGPADIDENAESVAESEEV
jgi:hypothetical protein